jgi:hypothetical protein
MHQSARQTDEKQLKVRNSEQQNRLEEVFVSFRLQ